MIVLFVVWLTVCQFLTVIQCNKIATVFFLGNSTHACTRIPNAEAHVSYFTDVCFLFSGCYLLELRAGIA